MEQPQEMVAFMGFMFIACVRVLLAAMNVQLLPAPAFGRQAIARTAWRGGTTGRTCRPETAVKGAVARRAARRRRPGRGSADRPLIVQGNRPPDLAYQDKGLARRHRGKADEEGRHLVWRALPGHSRGLAHAQSRASATSSRAQHSSVRAAPPTGALGRSAANATTSGALPPRTMHRTA